MKKIMAIGIFIVLSLSLAQTGHADPTSAREIMDRLVSVYASCSTYLDEGQVKTVFLGEKFGRRTEIKPFSTAFERSGRFRFEFRQRRGEEEWDQFIAWQQGDVVKSWTQFDRKVKDEEGLSMVIAGFTGISSMASIRIPQLLMPDVLEARGLPSLTDLNLAGEEAVEGRAAFKVEGKHPRGDTVTLWIDKESYLVVRIYEKYKVSDFEVEQTTDYRPQVNTEIPAEKLDFNPPEPRAEAEKGPAERRPDV